MSISTTINDRDSPTYKYCYICPHNTHDHRKATENEIAQYRLYKFIKNGCFICSPTISLKSLNISWNCPRYIETRIEDISLDIKCLFIKACSNVNNATYLPLEIIMKIIKFGNIQIETSEVSIITCDLVKHIEQCKECSNKTLEINTTKTCSFHIIPRSQIKQNKYY